MPTYDITCYYSGGQAHAQWFNGTWIGSNANNATVIQAAINDLPDGGTILLKNKFVLPSSLTSTADIAFVGTGYQAGLSGTVDPLITIDGDDSGDIKMYATPHNILKDLVIETLGNNNGVKTANVNVNGKGNAVNATGGNVAGTITFGLTALSKTLFLGNLRLPHEPSAEILYSVAAYSSVWV